MPLFFVLTLLANGPLAVFLPVAYEPVLMVFARLYPVWELTLVGTVGAALIEVVNYRMFRAAVQADRLAAFRASRLARRLARGLARRPFLTVMAGAFVPIPFWLVRIAGALARYPAPRFVMATAAGRLPRFAGYCALVAVVPLSDSAMLLGAGVLTVLFLLPLLSHR